MIQELLFLWFTWYTLYSVQGRSCNLLLQIQIEMFDWTHSVFIPLHLQDINFNLRLIHINIILFFKLQVTWKDQVAPHNVHVYFPVFMCFRGTWTWKWTKVLERCYWNSSLLQLLCLILPFNVSPEYFFTEPLLTLKLWLLKDFSMLVWMLFCLKIFFLFFMSR